MNDKYRSDLTQGKVGKMLLKFTIPFLLAQVLQALYGIVDMFIVGQFMGDYGITAVNTSSNVSYFITNLVSGFAMSGTVLVAQYIGAKEEENAKKTIGTIFTMFIILSIVVTVVGLLFAPTLLTILKTPVEAYKEACNYLYICFTGTIFICGYNAVSAVLRGLGDSKRPLVFVAIAAGTNVVLEEPKVVNGQTYKDEVTVAFDNTKIIYKLGDGIHEWADLEAVSLEEALDKGYIYHNGGVNNIHKIKINIKKLDAESIGELIYFFELACAISPDDKFLSNMK